MAELNIKVTMEGMEKSLEEFFTEILEHSRHCYEHKLGAISSGSESHSSTSDHRSVYLTVTNTKTDHFDSKPSICLPCLIRMKTYTSLICQLWCGLYYYHSGDFHKNEVYRTHEGDKYKVLHKSPLQITLVKVE